jgi:hypothetical protein
MRATPCVERHEAGQDWRGSHLCCPRHHDEEPCFSRSLQLLSLAASTRRTSPDRAQGQPQRRTSHTITQSGESAPW